MLFKKLGERGYRDIEGVVAIVMVKVVDLLLGGEALSLLEGGERQALVVDGVYKWREASGRVVVDIATLLEQKRDLLFVAGLSWSALEASAGKREWNLVVDEIAYIWRA